MAQANWCKLLLLFLFIKNISGQKLIKCLYTNITLETSGQICHFWNVSWPASLNNAQLNNDNSILALVCRDSQIQVWRNVICNAFVNIEQILAASVRLETIEEDAFVSCVRLRHLVFSRNFLKILSPKVFTENRALSSIDLSNNHLTEVDVNLFANTSLESLSLDANRIKEFKEMPITNGLKNLYLHGNQLRSLNVTELKQKYPKLEGISIADNNIPCFRENQICAEMSIIRCQKSDCVEDGMSTMKPEIEVTTVVDDEKPKIDNVQDKKEILVLVFISIGSLVLVITGVAVGWRIKRSREERTRSNSTPEVSFQGVPSVETRNVPYPVLGQTMGGVRRDDPYYEYVTGFYDDVPDYDDVTIPPATAEPYDHLQFNQQ